MKITPDSFSEWTNSALEFMLLCSLCRFDTPAMCGACHGREKAQIIVRICEASKSKSFRHFVSGMLVDSAEVARENELLRRTINEFARHRGMN